MKADIFKYKLPEDRIAKHPPRIRGTSNLLVYNRKTKDIQHKKYFNIVEYIKPGDIVVLNETRVLNVRTYFLNEKWRELEVLFLNEENGNWFCLIGGGRYVKDGDILSAKGNKRIKIKVLTKKDRGYLVEILGGIEAHEIFQEIGHTPLPPYMKRDDNKNDSKRYNTVFNKVPGSSAAPTASLNLTKKIIKQIENKGAKILKVELRVGWGTFAPIREENIEDHKIHQEYINISKEVADEINKAKESGNDVWAFGTTVTRTLESSVKNRKVQQYSGTTNLYIYPGYEFKIVDHLITNFHQPDSTLILLVSAFAGIEEIKKLYNIALDNDYKFLSYGDSMLII
ncbi:MAG: tRNA preQ1(34) S-adenosylmethionine ribosyltransferase-isomerase QueA [Candidatus Dojkabacteria bacterium]|nr:tRNA preQ1(34) S-adenosylmethionine ribosyltransferase-isomerase QueA [Candidatus Dojkabacteria bacterium]